MQVKKFEAKNMQEALAVVKRELGPEAIIVSTKENKRAFGLLNAPSIEVTAAVSDHALLKKKLAESKMKESFKEKVQGANAKVQANIYDRFARKVAPADKNTPDQKREQQRAEARKIATRPIVEPHFESLTKKYIDVHDADTEKELVPIAKPASPKIAESSGEASFGEFGLLREQLLWAGVDSSVASQIIRIVHSDSEIWKSMRKEDVAHKLEQLLSSTLNYVRVGKPIGDLRADSVRVFAFIGGTGVGKTTTIAKLATRLHLQGKKIAFLSSDTFRMGGVQQLQSYSSILNVPLLTLDAPEETAASIGELLASADIILVDSPGCSVHDVERLSFVQKMLKQIPRVHTFLVSAVNQRSALRPSGENAWRFGGIPFDGHIFTKLDEVDLRGEIVNQAFTSKRPVHYLCSGQNVPDDLEIATRESIAKAVFHHLVREF